MLQLPGELLFLLSMKLLRTLQFLLMAKLPCRTILNHMSMYPWMLEIEIWDLEVSCFSIQQHLVGQESREWQ
jgi:hypothetical protein